MKIKVGLNKQSVKNAINALKTAKKQLQGEMLNEFYKECYNYFVGRANYYLSLSDIGEVVKGHIQTSWSFEKTTSGAKIINNANIRKLVGGKYQEVPIAVLVEFGVGIVGGGEKHPNATETGYEYNVPSEYKDYDGSWKFNTFEDELDIPHNAISYQLPNDEGGIWVKTYGTKGVWYAFNALEDLRLEYKNIWERIKIKYWG